jgi:nucleotide-binding universal stress UspA family protein
MKILLAIDGSAASQAAVDSIAKRPLNDDTQILILKVYEKDYVPATMPGTIGTVTFHEDERHPSQNAAVKATTDAAKKIQEAHPNIELEQVQVEGVAKKVIIDEAKKFNADLIVLGSKGHGALEGFFMGSVSMAIVQHAPCSVEIVR